MPKDKVHIVPHVGVRLCSASKRKCKYQHFDDIQEANKVFEKQTAAQERATKNATEEYTARMRNLSREEHPSIIVDLNRRNDSMRAFANRIEATENNTGITPSIISAKAEYLIRGEKGDDIRFTANKMHKVVGVPPSITTYWKVSTVSSLRGTLEQKDFPLMTTQDGRAMKRGVHSMVTDATRRSFSSQSRADEERAKIIDGFVNVVNSVETMERGSARADALGFSFFKGSNKNVLVAKADLSETSFTARNIRQALASENYQTNVPQLDITVQDSLAKTSKNFWTIKSTDGKTWTLHKSFEGGREEVYGPSDNPEHLANEVYHFAQTMKNDEKYKEHSRRYIYNLIKETREAIGRHAIDVDANQQKRQAYRDRISGRTPYPKKEKQGGIKGILKKVFE